MQWHQVMLGTAAKSISACGVYATFGLGQSQGRPDSLIFFHYYICSDHCLPHYRLEEKAEMNEFKHFSLLSHKTLM